MLPRRTRQGESDPDGPTNHRRKELSGSDRRRSVESLVKPPRRVRGGPRPRWSPRGTAGRPQARRCRGRKGSERLKGRSGVDRTKHQPGPGRIRLRRRRRAAEAERVWNGDGVPGTPGPSGAVGCRKERECRIPPGISGRVGLGFGDRRVVRKSGQGAAPGRHPESGSSDGTDRRVEMGRGFGSEELTGSPGGYSGPISFFGPLLGWTFEMGVFRARTRPSPPAPSGPPFPLRRRPARGVGGDRHRPTPPGPRQSGSRSVHSARGC